MSRADRVAGVVLGQQWDKAMAEAWGRLASNALAEAVFQNEEMELLWELSQRVAKGSKFSPWRWAPNYLDIEQDNKLEWEP